MMKRINRLLYRSTSADQFATLFYGVVDLASGTVRFANAGHDFPVLVNGGGVCRLEEGDIVLGCVEDYPYKEHSCTIPARGGLVLYTDGLTEASADDVFFGQKRLETLLTAHSGKSARQMCDAILSEVTAFTNNDETQDDVTLLILKRKELH
jgi:sigma-B regulation protein RsbU (phosphoserine phosphatase)